MGFLSERERRDLSNRVTKSYGVRKFLIILDVVLLLAFIIMIFVSQYLAKKGYTQWAIWEGEEFKSIGGLTTFGIIMLIVAIILVILSITSIILTFSVRSPKSITEDVIELGSAAPSKPKGPKKTASKKEMLTERIWGGSDRK